MLVQRDAKVQFIEFNLCYHTSSGNFNHLGHNDLSYTAVVDNAHVNLTPLGKLLMPPPMSEKQILIGNTCQAVCIYGHTFVAVAGEQLVVFDAEKIDPKTLNTLFRINLS